MVVAQGLEWGKEDAESSGVQRGALMPNTWSTAGVGCWGGSGMGSAPKHSTSSFPSFPAWGKYVELSQINSEHQHINAPKLLLLRACPGFCHVQELPTRCLAGQDSGQSVAASGLVTKFVLLLDLRGDHGCMWSPVRTAGRSALGSGAWGQRAARFLPAQEGFLMCQ